MVQDWLPVGPFAAELNVSQTKPVPTLRRHLFLRMARLLVLGALVNVLVAWTFTVINGSDMSGAWVGWGPFFFVSWMPVHFRYHLSGPRVSHCGLHPRRCL